MTKLACRLRGAKSQTSEGYEFSYSKRMTGKLEKDDTGVRTTVENFLQTNITMREEKKTSLKRRPLFDLVSRKVKRMISC